MVVLCVDLCVSVKLVIKGEKDKHHASGCLSRAAESAVLNHDCSLRPDVEECSLAVTALSEYASIFEQASQTHCRHFSGLQLEVNPIHLCLVELVISTFFLMQTIDQR